MKKVFVYILICMFVLLLSSCYKTYYTEKRQGQVIGYQVFDLSGNEILGTYVVEYCIYESCVNEISSIPLNSPAPSMMYYVVDIEKNQDFMITIIIKSVLNLEVKRLRTNYGDYEIEDFYSNTTDDEFQYISILVENVDTENQVFIVRDLFMYDPLDSSKNIVNGTTWQFSRTYYEGVYFRFNE